MITATEKKLVIKTWGKQYTSGILQGFAKLHIKNANGNDFSPNSISLLVCGHRENVALEIEIMKLVNKTIKAKKVLQEKRKKLSKK